MGVPVLVLTHWFDPTADSVVRALAARGAEVFRCDAADFPQRLTMTARLTEQGWSATLKTQHREVDLGEIVGAYYRRPSTWEFPGDLSDEEREWAASEARFGLGGLLSAAVPWLNHPAAIARAEYKPVQLHEAVRCGLRVLPTLMTNDPPEAAGFARAFGDQVIYKSLSGETVSDDRGTGVIFTTPVTADECADPSIAGTVHQFQQRLPGKRHDVRITVVDNQFFAAPIGSSSEEGRLDWRRDYDSLSYEVEAVPAEVEVGIQRFMKRLDLRFGTFDFGVTESGDWMFYEINPNGQWGWIEDETAMPIAEAIAEALMSRGAFT